MKVLYIQYAGDFSEAYTRLFVEHGKENYYGQKYSVGAVVDQAQNGMDVLVVVLNSDGYSCKLTENLRSIGLTRADDKYRRMHEIIEEFEPDRVILRLPDIKILRLLRKKNIPTFPVFADSFEKMGRFRGRINKFFLSRELANRRIRWIANHQINASRSVEKLGVEKKKILPYDWLHSSSPEEWSKIAATDIATKTIDIFYAGAISKAKGIYDLIQAIPCIQRSGRKATLQIAGGGNEELTDFISSMDLEANVTILGKISHDNVLQNMNDADLVAVPSRHDYPEGLPMTIMESLMVGTPVAASDHPMFVGRVGIRGAVEFYMENNPDDIARTILKMCSDYSDYKRRCENAALEWHDLCLDLKWADMINAWLVDPEKCDFSEYTLASLSKANQ